MSLSIFLIAAGAILAWAVDVSVSGVNIQLVGAILLMVGILGFIGSLIFWSSWGGFGGAGSGSSASSPQTTVIKE